ncbi:MAG: YceI family protein [Flavobacterium sp.]|nr:YceI family protein [Flavobacterium sp.]
MKKLFSLLFVGLLSSTMVAQTSWKADPMHSKLTFSATHLGIADVAGLFKNFELTATGKNADFSDAVFELSADVASIDTEVDMRDEHLRSADFFEVEKYPKMTFKSTSIKKSGDNRYKVTGNLTIRGMSKPVTLDFWYRGTVENPQSKATTAGFQVTGTIKRSDFGVGPNFKPPMISDEIAIKADGEFIKNK